MSDKNNKKTRSLGDIASIIGNVNKKHSAEISKAAQEFKLPKFEKQEVPIENIPIKQEVPIENTSIPKKIIENNQKIEVTNIDKFQIESRVAKVPESFKIKPALKFAVEEIVTIAKKQGLNTSKGQIYNLLIAKGLES